MFGLPEGTDTQVVLKYNMHFCRADGAAAGARAVAFGRPGVTQGTQKSSPDAQGWSRKARKKHGRTVSSTIGEQHMLS